MLALWIFAGSLVMFSLMFAIGACRVSSKPLPEVPEKPGPGMPTWPVVGDDAA